MPQIGNCVMVHAHYKTKNTYTQKNRQGGVGACPHQSVNKLVKVLHCDLLEKVHISKDIDWSWAKEYTIIYTYNVKEINWINYACGRVRGKVHVHIIYTVAVWFTEVHTYF